VLRLLRGESIDAVSREIGVEIYRLEQWRDLALQGMDANLKEPPYRRRECRTRRRHEAPR
jgi:hypothetical protein